MPEPTGNSPYSRPQDKIDDMLKDGHITIEAIFHTRQHWLREHGRDFTNEEKIALWDEYIINLENVQLHH